MATATTATVLTNATDANFRAWGSWLSSLFATFGWTLVSQVFATGTDWTNVTTPAAGNTARVTERWKMGDALQATAPIFVTIEYGSAATLANPAIRLRCNTADLLGGTLLFDSGATFMNLLANGNPMTHYASGSSSRIQVMMGVSGIAWGGNNMLRLNIERRKTQAGADASTGFLIAIATGVTGQLSRGASATGPHPITRASWDFPTVMTAAADGTFDGSTQFAPLMFLVGSIEFTPSWGAIPVGAFAVGATFTADIFGVSHTYVASQLGSPGTAIVGGSSSVQVMRYE